MQTPLDTFTIGVSFQMREKGDTSVCPLIKETKTGLLRTCKRIILKERIATQKTI